MMTKTIWEFAIGGPRLHADFALPEGAEELSAQWQDGAGIVLWALCNPEHKMEVRRYLIYGTGWTIPDMPGRYVGTVQAPDGLVWHVFKAEREQ
jgi:hypothetical protein